MLDIAQNTTPQEGSASRKQEWGSQTRAIQRHIPEDGTLYGNGPSGSLKLLAAELADVQEGLNSTKLVMVYLMMLTVFRTV
jgi:hypothetical protein